MNLYQISTIGSFHVNHNEDALTVNHLNQDKILLAVLDGCSMGTESHFASCLLVKIIRKVTKEISFKAFAEKTEKTTASYLKVILQQVFLDLQQISQQLMLEVEEILTTVVLCVLDHTLREAACIVIGDGLIICNDQCFEYEQGNKPDYLGYHLQENFEDWYQQQSQKLWLPRVQQLSLASDGIFSFKHYDTEIYDTITESEIIDFLLRDQQWMEQSLMLHKKLLYLENTFGIKPSDDLSIIRIILDAAA
ncbi:MAG: protein phosphatase 2C domain-containing protein [Saprospiraceae bacterium]